MTTGTIPRRTYLVALSGVFILMVLVLLWPSSARAQDTGADDFVDGEVVVKINKTTGTTIQDVYNQYPEVDETKTEVFLESSGIYLLTLEPGSDTEAAAENMGSDSGRMIYAELNFKTDTPEGGGRMRSFGDADPEPSADSSLYQSQYAVGALNLSSCARNISKGAGTTVAVLDTGVQADHPALAGSLVPGYDFVDDDNTPSDEGNGVNDDGDGYTDASGGQTPLVDEGVGHGTHVAGIVHLTAPEAKIMSMRVLDSDGTGNTFVIAEAIREAVDPDGDPATKDGVDVINVSLGTAWESDLIRDVADDLDAVEDDDDDDQTGPALNPVSVPTEGVVVTASAGNSGAETMSYPAAEPNGVLAVASVGQDKKKSDFSNYGSWVDVSAPGDDIYSAFPTSQYAQWDGTSMAAPFVAGQAALVRSLKQDLPAEAPQGTQSVESVIENNAQSLKEIDPDHDGKLGAGLPDVFASLKELRPNATCGTTQPPPPNTAPTISVPRPVPGSATRDRTPLLGATVRDAQTNLMKGNVSLFLDGRRINRFSYNTSTDRLSYTTGRLSYARHTVKVIARDPQGLSRTGTWSLRVIR